MGEWSVTIKGLLYGDERDLHVDYSGGYLNPHMWHRMTYTYCTNVIFLVFILYYNYIRYNSGNRISPCYLCSILWLLLFQISFLNAGKRLVLNLPGKINKYLEKIFLSWSQSTKLLSIPADSTYYTFGSIRPLTYTQQWMDGHNLDLCNNKISG